MPLEPIGAMPKVSAEMRAAAIGVAAPRAAVVPDETLATLRGVSTATLTTQLQRRGIRSPFMAGLRPTRPDLRWSGSRTRCATCRCARTSSRRTQGAERAEGGGREHLARRGARDRRAGRGRAPGTIGDILALRALRRGAAGIVTDGGLRDSPAVAALEHPDLLTGRRMPACSGCSTTRSRRTCRSRAAACSCCRAT